MYCSVACVCVCAPAHAQRVVPTSGSVKTVAASALANAATASIIALTDLTNTTVGVSAPDGSDEHTCRGE